jgi:hypothetical protein
MTLDEIAIKHGTDKSSKIHNYCVKYEKYFNFDREKELKILEIGVLNGASVKSWSEFYPNSLIVGIDINNDCKIYESEKIKIEIGSQIDEKFLMSVIEKYGEFDFIIDDGSHFQSHMIKSFKILFPYVKKSGLYIVEDICCSYWDSYEGGYRKTGTSVEYFKNLIDDINFNGKMVENFIPNVARKEDLLIEQVKMKKENIRIDIESINFMNSIVIVTKR